MDFSFWIPILVLLGLLVLGLMFVFVTGCDKV